MMPSIGTIIAVLILAVIMYFAVRETIKEIRREISGQGCSGCSGCRSGHCSSCGSHNQIDMKKVRRIIKAKAQKQPGRRV
jgi:hypothetical protein